MKLSTADSDDDDSKDSAYSPSSSNDGLRPLHNSSSNHNKAPAVRTNFTNALLRVGTKSTKDSTLDKPVRKGPGLLLEAAGRSLLQKACSSSTLNLKSGGGGSSMLSSGATIGGLSFGLASAKISFGLYGGHLPVDHGSYTKPDTDEENSSSSNNASAADASSRVTAVADDHEDDFASTKKSSALISSTSPETIIKAKVDQPLISRQKVFSNWGGEFFKKNLDYRANTNKILEKMNLNSKNSNGGPGSDQASTSSTAASSANTGFKSLVVRDVAAAKRSLNDRSAGGGGAGAGDTSPAKKLKSSFLNSYT